MSDIPRRPLDRELQKLRKMLGDTSGSALRELERAIAARRLTGHFNEDPIVTAVRNLLSRAEVTKENLDYLTMRIRAGDAL